MFSAEHHRLAVYIVPLSSVYAPMTTSCIGFVLVNELPAVAWKFTGRSARQDPRLELAKQPIVACTFRKYAHTTLCGWMTQWRAKGTLSRSTIAH